MTLAIKVSNRHYSKMLLLTACLAQQIGYYTLSLKSDQRQFSPHSIDFNAQKKFWQLIKWSPKIFCQFFSTTSLSKCMEISLVEFVCWYGGLRG